VYRSQIRDVDQLIEERSRYSDGTGCFRIEVRTDTAKLTDVRITGLKSDEI